MKADMPSLVAGKLGLHNLAVVESLRTEPRRKMISSYVTKLWKPEAPARRRREKLSGYNSRWRCKFPLSTKNRIGNVSP